MKNLFYAQGKGDFVNLENGECYNIFSEPTKLTTNGSGQIVISNYAVNTTAYVQKADKSAVKFVTSATTTLSTGWNSTEIYIIYRLSAQNTENCHYNVIINPNHNNIIVTSYQQDEFTGDGSTTVFALSETAENTTYSVYLNGIEQENVTKTTTNVTFTTAPKNGQLIRVCYNSSNSTTWGINADMLEPTGSKMELDDNFTSVSVTINEISEEFRMAGTLKQKRKVGHDVKITLPFTMLQNAENFYKTWKDKKFRLILTDIGSTSNAVDIAANCYIDGEINHDYNTGIVTIGIYATDYYYGIIE